MEYEQLLNQASNLAQLNKALTRYLLSYGISAFTFTYYTNIAGSKHALFHELVSDNLKAWHAYYHQENFSQVDQTYQKVNKLNIPVFWDLQEQLNSAKTEKEKRMRQEGLNLGVRVGLAIPVHGPKGDYAELSLRQFQHETCLIPWQEHKYAWQCAALYYYHHLHAHLSPPSIQIEFHLTPRELQCLQLLIQNYSTLEIASNLSMTERTVNFHIQNINHKLGTKNKYQSISKALKLKAFE